MLESAVGTGRVFCYTNDIGVLLSDMKLLPKLMAVFSAFESAAGLKLKVAKCALIRLGAETMHDWPGIVQS